MKYGIYIPHVELFIDCLVKKENMLYITATFKVEIVSFIFVLKKPKMHWISIIMYYDVCKYPVMILFNTLYLLHAFV
jgi:hypothetical protein